MRFSETRAAAPLPPRLVIPEAPDLRFAGFSNRAFDVLSRLRAKPTAENYHVLKSQLREFVHEPFREFRDDLVVAYVLPNRLPMETERNVFSRFLKNDFGAGASHSHLWLSFYRIGRTRLKDVQLASSISPDGFAVGLHVAPRMGAVQRSFYERNRARPDHFADMVAGLQSRHFSISLSGVVLPEGETRAALRSMRVSDRVSVRAMLPAGEVVQVRGRLIMWALAQTQLLWPLYRYVAGS